MGTQLSKRRESLLRALTTRHGRKNSAFCLAEGLRCVREIITISPASVELCILRKGIPSPELPEEKIAVLEPKEYDGLAGTVSSQGIMAIVKQPEYIPLDAPLRDSYALVLDRVADPGNFGTIVRTARAVGLHEIWTVKGGVDPFAEKTIRSASSAQFAVGIRMAESLDQLVETLKKQKIIRFYRTEPAEGHSVFQEEELFHHSAIVLGNEANGAGPVPDSLPLNIPMPGSAESLNVALAAAVILFESVRRMDKSV